MRGYVIIAVGDIKYRKCADTLQKSIHRVMPHAKVTLITDKWVLNDGSYDKIVTLPYSDVDGSDWKLANDWQVYEASPYDETIKLEADMYIPRSIDYWWDVLEDRELNISTTIRDFRGNISANNYYRQTFTKSKLPQTYNAITYFKKGELSKRFYDLVREIFTNWSEWVTLLDYSSEDRPTTDVVYGIAAKIIGVEHCTLPTFTEFSMTHMKPAINDNTTSRWHEEMVYEIHGNVFRINTYPQMYPVHYYNKEFAQIIDEELDND
jgi:hypothetical protein